ncbi:hypothetical protein H4219_001322 [Mycoemilia scoparia]|uniref:J domain-containing protein n=1 Tax=Mycoemilia scoparia TaxID=417184 RepID=A0A9W8A8L1_9FUNG|nr:hypothetical protein H4219_001322 [Mycoemilia scoparia]
MSILIRLNDLLRIGLILCPTYPFAITQHLFYSIYYRGRSADQTPEPGSTDYRKHKNRIFVILAIAYFIVNLRLEIMFQPRNYYDIMKVDPPLTFKLNYYRHTNTSAAVQWYDLSLMQKAESEFLTKLDESYEALIFSDLNSNKGDSYFRTIDNAYSTLKNPVKRFAYDRMGEEYKKCDKCHTIDDYIMSCVFDKAEMFAAATLLWALYFHILRFPKGCMFLKNRVVFLTLVVRLALELRFALSIDIQIPQVAVIGSWLGFKSFFEISNIFAEVGSLLYDVIVFFKFNYEFSKLQANVGHPTNCFSHADGEDKDKYDRQIKRLGYLDEFKDLKKNKIAKELFPAIDELDANIDQIYAQELFAPLSSASPDNNPSYKDFLMTTVFDELLKNDDNYNSSEDLESENENLKLKAEVIRNAILKQHQ